MFMQLISWMDVIKSFCYLGKIIVGGGDFVVNTIESVQASLENVVPV